MADEQDSSVGEIVPPAEVAAAPVKTAPGETPQTRFSRTMINLGFMVGLALAVFCLVIAGWYLLAYLNYGTTALQDNAGTPFEPGRVLGHLYIARVLLQSCGLAVGMAFGFLGFSLFLLGVGGNMDASATGAGEVGIQVARISPGAFVMLCSAILVGLCATRDPQTSMGMTVRDGAETNQSSGYNGLAANSAHDSSTNWADIPPDNATAANESGE
jgi:hypothetical protein